MKTLFPLLIHIKPLHALARAGQFPVDKAGQLSKSLGAGMKQQLLLGPDSGGPFLPARRRADPRRGSRREGQGGCEGH